MKASDLRNGRCRERATLAFFTDFEVGVIHGVENRVRPARHQGEKNPRGRQAGKRQNQDADGHYSQATAMAGGLDLLISTVARLIDFVGRNMLVLSNVNWAANKRFEISKFKFKIPRARTSELQGSFSAVSKPNFASKYSLESSRRDLHNALLCTVL